VIQPRASLTSTTRNAADDLKAIDAKLAEIRGANRIEDFLAAMTDRETSCLVTLPVHRGDPKQPK